MLVTLTWVAVAELPEHANAFVADVAVAELPEHDADTVEVAALPPISVVQLGARVVPLDCKTCPAVPFAKKDVVLLAD